MKTRMSSLLAVIAAGALLAACSQSDVGISTNIKAKMAADPTVQAGQIEVTTADGVVTLEGNIDSEEAKQRALQLARETKGVVKVTDMIAVRRASGDGDAPDPGRTVGVTIDDAGITVRVKERLLDDPVVKGLQIDVDTRAGVVYLTGSVGTEAEKEQAVKLARETEGVKDVQPNLKIGKG